MELLPGVALAAGTLVSEDGTCILAGLAAAQGRISTATAIAGCGVGIFAGDGALWLIGRVAGARLLRSRWVARRWTEDSIRQWSDRLERNAATVILASRFLPGTRLPLYLAAGALRGRARTFFLWTFIAVALWTPLLVLGSAYLGPIALSSVAILQLLRRVDLARLRLRVAARVARLARWEFWPSAVIYGPVAAWIAWLAIRHRSLGVFAAANPGFPEGGFVGESKFQILSQLPQQWTIPAALIEPDAVHGRLMALRALTEWEGWNFPLVLKPDTGQRGVGVRKVTDIESAHAYFAQQPYRVLAQPYHPGPFEAGIFYYRLPHDARGRIFSITAKEFPVLIGNGQSPIEDLIWQHPRYRLQADVFLARHAAVRRRVLLAGERFPLAVAGNHAQGTMFLDGSHLWTPALEARIDTIARSTPGFYFGRFDVRYSDLDRFRKGEDLAIVELNGVTSESTNIYDPAFSVLHAWRVLRRQWTLAFEIGAANRARGVEPVSGARLLQLSIAYLRARPVLPIAS